MPSTPSTAANNNELPVHRTPSIRIAPMPRSSTNHRHRPPGSQHHPGSPTPRTETRLHRARGSYCSPATKVHDNRGGRRNMSLPCCELPSAWRLSKPCNAKRLVTDTPRHAHGKPATSPADQAAFRSGGEPAHPPPVPKPIRLGKPGRSSPPSESSPGPRRGRRPRRPSCCIRLRCPTSTEMRDR